MKNKILFTLILSIISCGLLRAQCTNVNQPASQTICSGTASTAISFSPASYDAVKSWSASWTNNNTGTGLTASGMGDIPSFTAVNTTTPVISTITVTPKSVSGTSLVINKQVIPSSNGLGNGSTNPIYANTIFAQPFVPVSSSVCGASVTENGYGTTTAVTSISLWDNLPTSGGHKLAEGAVSVTGTTSPVVLWDPVTVIPGNTYFILVSSSVNFGFAITTVSGSSIYSKSPSDATFSQTPVSFNFSLTYKVYSSGTLTTCTGSPATFSITVNPLPVATLASTTQTICGGDTTHITPSSTISGTTYKWTASATTGISGAVTDSGNTITQTLINSGNSQGSAFYTIQAISPGGCIAAATINDTVKVKPLPATPTAGSNSPVCSGQTINLTASSPTPGATYRWTGPNNFISIAQNLSFPSTIYAAGGYFVSALLNGCRSATADTVIVDFIPIPVLAVNTSSNPTTCNGTNGSITFTGGGYPSTAYTARYIRNGTVVTRTINTSATGTFAIYGLSAGTYDSITVAMANTSCTSAPIGPVTLTDPPAPATPVITSNSPVCAGQGLSISTPYISGISNNWTTPHFSGLATNISFGITDSSYNGTYTLTQTNTATGCSTTATLNVVIKPLPAAPAASSNGSVCAGQAINLAASSATSGATYSWTGPNSFISTAQNPSITSTTTAMSGTYSVYAMLNGCQSTTAGTVNAYVNPTPVIAGSSSVNPATCNGSNGSISLTGLLPTFNYTVNYTKNGTAVAPVTILNTGTGTLTIPNLSAGTYDNITVTIPATGCTSAAAGPFTLTDPAVPATPAASSNSAICAGQTLNLVTPSVNGMSYNWTGPNGFTSNSPNPSISNTAAATAGIYSVTLKNNTTGCTSAPGTVTVIVNPLPAAPLASSDSAICVGQTLHLTTPTVSGMSYNWTGPNSFTSGSQNPSVTNAATPATGTYSVTLKNNATGCVSVPGTVNATVNPLPATPAASSNSAVCAGQMLNLTTPTVNGMSYNWTGPNSFTSALQNPSVSNATTAIAGTYSVKLTNITTGCVSAAGTTAVVVNPLPSAPVAGSNTPVCAGQSLNLITPVMSGVSYSWTGPNSFSSGQQNPVITNAATGASGTYSVTLTDMSTGCTSFAAFTTVTIKPLPATPVAGANSPVCAGQPISLTASASTTGATYSWTGPNSFNTATQNPSIAGSTAASSGTYTVYALLNGCQSAAGTVNVTVNPLPAATATATGPMVICANDSVLLQANTGAGLSYQWLYNTSPVSNASAGSYHASQAGNYAVKVTNSYGCSATSAPVSVSVYPVPVSTITYNSPTSFCDGGAVVLRTVIDTTYQYQWLMNGVPIPYAIGSYNVASQAGDYSMKVSTALGCSAVSQIVHVTVYPLPHPLITRNGNLLTATAGFTTYQWCNNGIPIPGETGASLHLAQNGNYYVIVTDANGCTNTSALAYINWLGIGTVQAGVAIKVYPNPTRQVVYIDAPVKVNVQVRDLTGRVLITKENVKEVDLGDVADGIYMLCISDAEGRLLETDKIFKN